MLRIANILDYPDFQENIFKKNNFSWQTIKEKSKNLKIKHISSL